MGALEERGVPDLVFADAGFRYTRTLGGEGG